MPHVLVIDDQVYARAAVAVALRTSGFEVTGFENGRTALLAMENAHFDLAIVDIFMPNMDGVKLIRCMRERCPDLAVIAMSGAFLSSSGRTVLDLLPAAGDLANVVRLKKPFRANELMRAIELALGVAA
jgi:DNA-binding NtrC family response regulator